MTEKEGNERLPCLLRLAMPRLFMHLQPAASLLGPPQALPEECSSMARAPVSKTGGWGFESLHSCQARESSETTKPRVSKRAVSQVARVANLREQRCLAGMLRRNATFS